MKNINSKWMLGLITSAVAVSCGTSESDRSNQSPQEMAQKCYQQLGIQMSPVPTPQELSEVMNKLSVLEQSGNLSTECKQAIELGSLQSSVSLPTPSPTPLQTPVTLQKPNLQVAYFEKKAYDPEYNPNNKLYNLVYQWIDTSIGETRWRLMYESTPSCPVAEGGSSPIQLSSIQAAKSMESGGTLHFANHFGIPDCDVYVYLRAETNDLKSIHSDKILVKSPN